MTDGLQNFPHVEKIISCYLETGSTQPLLCVLNNGMQAVVKYLNNCSGNLVLINEYLAYKIAIKICLNVPQSGFCILDDRYISSEEFMKLQACEEFKLFPDNYGIGFYSSFISQGVPMSFGLVPNINNLDDFYRMIIFDHLIYNKDRHPGNIIVSLNKPIRFFAIDHSHVFKNQTIWDQYAFRQGIKNDDYKDLDILQLNKEVYDYFLTTISIDNKKLLSLRDEIFDCLSAQFYHNIISELPEQWTKCLTCEDIVSLEQYLNYRTSHLNEICDLIICERGTNR